MERIHRIHCSYHKCLTVYFKRVMHGVYNLCMPWSRGYRHFNSHLQNFNAQVEGLQVASVNNRALDLDGLAERLGRFKISRFLRDPRDLVVSAYFYHRRGAEDWVQLEAPTTDDWYFANAQIPGAMQARIDDGERLSYAAYLQSLPDEEGLLAELELRAPHLESMAAWPQQHPDILTLRYEDILGHEERAFGKIFDFYGMSSLEKTLGQFFVRRYALRKVKADPHVRNPSSGQWRQHFTPRVRQVFDARYGALVRDLGYPVD